MKLFPKRLYIRCIYNKIVATELITFKMDGAFLKEVDEAVKSQNYQNRTEFIRSALRDKVKEAELREFMKELNKLKGASKKKTTDEDWERVRELVSEEFDKKFR